MALPPDYLGLNTLPVISIQDRKWRFAHFKKIFLAIIKKLNFGFIPSSYGRLCVVTEAPNQKNLRILSGCLFFYPEYKDDEDVFVLLFDMFIGAKKRKAFWLNHLYLETP